MALEASSSRTHRFWYLCIIICNSCAALFWPMIESVGLAPLFHGFQVSILCWGLLGSNSSLLKQTWEGGTPKVWQYQPESGLAPTKTSNSTQLRLFNKSLRKIRMPCVKSDLQLGKETASPCIAYFLITALLTGLTTYKSDFSVKAILVFLLSSKTFSVLLCELEKTIAT